MSDKAFNIYDDPVFPSSITGMKMAGIFESATDKPSNSEDIILDSVQTFSQQQARTKAMSAVLAWVEDGNFSYLNLDEYIIGMADLDGDFEISDAEEAYYNEIWREVPDALLTLGAGAEDVAKFVNDEDDKSAAIVGKAADALVNELEADDDEIIAGFALGQEAVLENAGTDPDGRHMILEATYKRMKVVRDGQVQVVNKRMSGKVRISAAQKADLREARMKAHTAGANLARKKSMKMRKQHGI